MSDTCHDKSLVTYYQMQMLKLAYISRSSSHPLDNASFLSFTTFAWLSPTMWKLYRNKLDMSNLSPSPFDVADISGERSDFLLGIHGSAIFLI